MADGGLNVKLDKDAEARLTAMAEQAGVSPEALAGLMMHQLLDNPTGLVVPATSSSDYDGPYVELEDALDAFSTELHRRLAGRAS